MYMLIYVHAHVIHVYTCTKCRTCVRHISILIQLQYNYNNYVDYVHVLYHSVFQIHMYNKEHNTCK